MIRYALSILAVLSVLIATGAAPAPAAAQTEDAIRDELMGQFETSMAKFIALAEAMPAEQYRWSPGERVMEVGQVFMHVAHYNYMYPSDNMGRPLPSGVELEGMEAVRDRDRTIRTLQESRDWVWEVVGGMSTAELAGETRLYGRTLPRWAVLVQLVSHMNEHLGQAIAYARMNEVVPPWSR